LSSAANVPEIDRTDRRIIGELVEDGRISLAELGRRVNLSPPAVAERVKRLEQAGIVTGYRAEIDVRKLGYALTSIVRVKPSPGQLSRIPELAEQIPEVAECHRITGEDCFLMKVHVADIQALENTLDRFLMFAQTTTSIIQSSPVPPRALPLPTG